MDRPVGYAAFIEPGGWQASTPRHLSTIGAGAQRAIDDDAKEAMRAIVELPDQRENLFLRICMQNFAAGRGYALSKGKRALFAELTDEEISALETAIRAAFAPGWPEVNAPRRRCGCARAAHSPA